MPRKARLESKTGIYHVMLRGANRQEIFHDDEDCIRFLDTLFKYKTTADMNIFAWCLMNNHVHLLVKEGNEQLAVTMKRIGVSFAHYYHRKYWTTGHLFQDRFKSEIVETKTYLMTVVRYIHQNPVKAGIVKKIDGWPWSSCLTYYGKQTDFKSLLDREFILGMFSNDLSLFRKFNEEINEDVCLDMPIVNRLTDNEARTKIKKILGDVHITQVKILPRNERNDLIRRIKTIDGLSQRQASRILGISVYIINRA